MILAIGSISRFLPGKVFGLSCSPWSRHRRRDKGGGGGVRVPFWRCRRPIIGLCRAVKTPIFSTVMTPYFYRKSWLATGPSEAVRHGGGRSKKKNLQGERDREKEKEEKGERKREERRRKRDRRKRKERERRGRGKDVFPGCRPIMGVKHMWMQQSGICILDFAGDAILCSNFFCFSIVFTCLVSFIKIELGLLRLQTWTKSCIVCFYLYFSNQENLTPGGPLVFQVGYHPRKRTFRTHPKHVFFRYENRP